MLFSTLNVIRNHFIAKVQNKYVVKSEISRTLVGMVLKLVLFFFGIGLTGFILATAFDSILLASGYVVSYRRKVGGFRQWIFDANWCRLLLRESFPLRHYRNGSQLRRWRRQGRDLLPAIQTRAGTV